MLKLPFFAQLEAAENILISGAGGGYDVFSGLPLYFGLQAAGKKVYLANLSFSFLPPEGDRLSPSLLKVTADTNLYGDYFPEKFLSVWFREYAGQETSIYCFERTGVKPLLASYQALVEELALDTIILADGGTDSLMRGDEDGLGTPHEDIVSITAVNELPIPRKLMTCLGFGVDRFHGVSNELSLQAIAALTKSGGYLGMFSLMETMFEVKKFREASEYVFQQMPQSVSIVASSILSALAGHYGNHHATSRTRGSQLWINPLMPVYWTFQLDKVAERILYWDEVKETDDYMEVRSAIQTFRHQSSHTIKRRNPIPD
ncbi:MAG: DUF1152 domain-containing protein [Chloroflexi bacterium]|nr:DUF1152 domain-containing protein [Chloroflexota bacterium]